MANKVTKCKLQVPGLFRLETENIPSGTLIGLVALVFIFLMFLIWFVARYDSRQEKDPSQIDVSGIFAQIRGNPTATNRSIGYKKK
ncbi:MAG: hypothetical protein DI539_26565 [Flavobacterium psychrophilum]|nr:MAG: hypothetical protein DI539_26565 [Flavobacterium psychrophilum]